MTFVLGLDLDDVSAKYMDGLRDFIIKKYKNTRFAGLSIEESREQFQPLTSYDGFNWPIIDSDYDRFRELHAEAVEDGLFQKLEPMEGVTEILNRLEDKDNLHIYVITSRFIKHGQNARVLTDTAIWLDKHRIPYRDIMFVRNKVDVKADLYIDDSPRNIAALREAGREVIAFDQSYNQHLNHNDLRAKNWQEAEQIIKQKMRQQ